MVMRMPRMQVYLPEDLYQRVKAENLPASELLQAAVRAELQKRELGREADKYIAEVIAEFGEPTPEVKAWADDFMRRLHRHEHGAD